MMRPYFKITILCLGVIDNISPLKLLWKRIVKLYDDQVKRRNLRFVFTYLKEAYTITNFQRAGMHYNPKCRVRVDSRGFPTIIPSSLRNILSDDRRIFVAVATLLGVHRVIPWWPTVDLSTIVDPFNGVSKIIDLSLLKKAKSNLCSLLEIPNLRPFKYKFRLSKISGKVIESSGPNSSVAQWGIIEDAFAFYDDIPYLWVLFKWYWRFNGRRYLIWLAVIMILGYPYYLISNTQFHKGRLAVVYNTAGKARVVAMTNWWIQIALYPLHESIFRFLKRLPTDGTFDQLKPLKVLSDRGPGHFYSFDLSAATDRLPIDLQEQVLSLFTDKQTASMWRKIISIPFAFKGVNVNYAVGQPMGAYSSWGMLALTHHMIVQASSPIPTVDYAILGDDIVVKGKVISDRYLELMKTLGVSISLAKSIDSIEFMEFAKKLVTVGGLDYSILGPGLICSSVKNRLMSNLLVADSFYKGFIPNIPDAVETLRSLIPLKGIGFYFGLYSLLGPRGSLYSKDQETGELYSRATWLSLDRSFPDHSIRYSLYNALMQLYIDKSKRVIANAKASLSAFSFFYEPKRVRRSLIQGMLYYPLRLISPGPWLLLVKLQGSLAEPPLFQMEGTWSDIATLSALVKDIQIYQLDSLRRKQLVAISKSYVDLEINFYQSLRDLMNPEGEDIY